MINVIGSGLAGLSAAICLAETGVSCNLISEGASERAQSVLAEGGINAALNTMGEEDSPKEHFSDTLKGGGDLADPYAVEALCFHASEIIEYLEKIGVPFQRQEDGKILLRNFGGQKKKRTAFAKSSTGKVIMNALIDEARKYESSGLIRRFPHHRATEIVFKKAGGKGKCAGVKILDLYTDKLYFCTGPVILGAGGLNGFFPENVTGSLQNTGDLAAQLFSCGVNFANLEFIQYHPTTVGIPGKRMLISEAARGEGGRLFSLENGKKRYFMEELYPERGNLMPRDVISQESEKILKSDENNRIFLDFSEISEKIWSERLSDMRKEIKDFLGDHPKFKPVEVRPGIHFFMGGIAVDRRHKTNIDGLYAAGECAAIYHGANRLGGNSLLGAIYGGWIAAKSALSENICQYGEISETGLLSQEEKKAFEVSPKNAKRLRDILLSALGIIRRGDEISAALKDLEEFGTKGGFSLAEKNRILLGRAMLLSALSRKESRGAHFRTDFPQRDDENFGKKTVSSFKNGKIDITFEDISQGEEC